MKIDGASALMFEAVREQWFARHMSTGQAYLARLQESYLLQTGVSPRERFLMVQPAWKQFSEEVEKHNPNLSFEYTKEFVMWSGRFVLGRGVSLYEYPYEIGMLLQKSIDLENAIRQVHSSIFGLSVPVIGTLPTGQVNAASIFIPGYRTKIIAFASGLFTFALLISKVIAAVIGREQEIDLTASARDADIQFMDAHPEVLVKFQDLLDAYMFRGSIIEAAPYTLDGPPLNMAAHLLKGAELFLLAHEYAHLVLGHLAGGKTIEDPLSPEGMNATLWVPDPELELSADRVGFVTTLPILIRQGTPRVLCACGADMFLTFYDIIERAIVVLRTGEARFPSSATTHPLASTRRAALREQLRQTMAKDVEIAETSIFLCERIQAIVEHLWAQTVPIFRQHYSNRRELRRHWLRSQPVDSQVKDIQ
jgi:hypothetical protein